MITQKESWLNPNVEIKNSKVQGKGMFAKTQIKKGEIVYIWGGIFKTKKVTNWGRTSIILFVMSRFFQKTAHFSVR